MCRWIAYTGPKRNLGSVVVAPRHSLLTQSRHATEATFEVNADGFGIGWYGDRGTTPGVFRDTRPAWNDANLRSITEHLASTCFMAHIRASTSGDIARCNCHPFRHGDWLFQHNGGIGSFATVRHELDADIHPALYAAKEGATDTETMFLLALTYGLQDDPARGINRMIQRVEQARATNGIDAPFRMTIATTRGEDLFVARHASHGSAPSLYHSVHPAAVAHTSGDAQVAQSGMLVVSEPLDALPEHWAEIPAERFVRAHGGGIETTLLG